MKTLFKTLLTFVFTGLFTTLNAQTIQTSFKRSTLHWNEDITITDANSTVLQNSTITTTKKITISSPSKVDLSNTTITCNEIEIKSTDIIMDNVTIDCSTITFANTSNSLTVTKLTKINSKKVVFATPLGGSTDFSIKNIGPAELSITGILNRNNRTLILPQSDNFKVTFQEN
ncbi:hypothetical protein [Runella limosa]|uniref:hypothetical protein n=1 Tax=Runella limosa TaxID=370978 RepID=UPI00048A6AE3|nr:hypothetical protein [Runella limosa]